MGGVVGILATVDAALTEVEPAELRAAMRTAAARLQVASTGPAG